MNDIIPFDPAARLELIKALQKLTEISGENLRTLLDVVDNMGERGVKDPEAHRGIFEDVDVDGAKSEAVKLYSAALKDVFAHSSHLTPSERVGLKRIVVDDRATFDAHGLSLDEIPEL